MTISFTEFIQIDMRAGTIISVAEHTKAITPAYNLEIDFGHEKGSCGAQPPSQKGCGV